MQLTATSMDSVVIVVAKCTATRGSVLQDAGTSLICDLLKPPIAQIAIEILVLAVFQIGLRSIDFRINVSVRHEDVEPAIIIHVEEANTPSQQARIHSQAAWVSPILECSISQIGIKRIRVACEVCLYNIQISVPVIVADGNAHTCLRLGLRRERCPRLDDNVTRCS